MPLQLQSLNSEDRDAYRAWMRRICSFYAVAILLGLALVAFHATTPTDATAQSVNSDLTLAAD